MTGRVRAGTVQLRLPLIPALSPANRSGLLKLVGRDWRNRAACLGKRPDDWFPDPSDTVTTDRAATVCTSCPVARACLAAGLLTDEQGIWGGTTEPDRDRIRRRLAEGVPLPVVIATPTHLVRRAA